MLMGCTIEVYLPRPLLLHFYQLWFSQESLFWVQVRINKTSINSIKLISTLSGGINSAILYFHG